MQTLPDPASAAEAMDQVLSRLSYLAATDPTAMAAQAQTEGRYLGGRPPYGYHWVQVGGEFLGKRPQ